MAEAQPTQARAMLADLTAAWQLRGPTLGPRRLR